MPRMYPDRIPEIYRTDPARDGEADFVIAHPEHGIMVLEVKGGALGFDAVTGAWSSTSMSGRTHPLRESPFEQARRHRYELEKKLAETPGWRSSDATYGYAVAASD